jgi:hypothetical protein
VVLKVLLLALSCGLAMPPGFAQDTASTSAPDAPAAEANTSTQPVPSTDKTVLQGGVRGAALLLEDGLKKMGEATTGMQGAATRVINEVSRKDTITVRGPNVIGNGIVIPALPNPSGTMQFGELPAREKYLRTFTKQTTYYVELLQNEVDALMLPDNRSPEVEQLWTRLRTNMQQVQGYLASLKDLTVGPRFNNGKIARAALGVYDGAREINKLRRQLMKELKP